jgi:hypothetical protein
VGQRRGVPGSCDLAKPGVRHVVGDVPGGGKEGLGVRAVQHEYRDRDRTEHLWIIRAGSFGPRRLRELLEQRWDVATRSLEVVRLVGDGDLIAVEGNAEERPSRLRQVAFSGQLAHASDGSAETCPLLVVHQAEARGLHGRHRIYCVGLRPTESAMPSADQPTSPEDCPMLST